MSVAASLGLVYLWDSDVGTGKLDRYFYASEPYIKAGGMLGVGIANCGVQSEHDPALAMLSYEVSGDSDITKIGALLG
jgi:26S proteasome regulatory subunit N1